MFHSLYVTLLSLGAERSACRVWRKSRRLKSLLFRGTFRGFFSNFLLRPPNSTFTGRVPRRPRLACARQSREEQYEPLNPWHVVEGAGYPGWPNRRSNESLARERSVMARPSPPCVYIYIYICVCVCSRRSRRRASSPPLFADSTRREKQYSTSVSPVEKRPT